MLIEELRAEIFQLLKQAARPSEKNCRAVANRICNEVMRICTESQRIQDSGDVRSWAFNLANHRVEQCIRYYKLGSERGRIELHITLSAIIYRHISVPGAQVTYQARLSLMEDFLKNFYHEAMTVFRQENQMAADYRLRRGLALSEFMAFTEFYGKRRISLERGRSQLLIVLRAQSFAKQQLRASDENTESAKGNALERKNTSFQRLWEDLSLRSDGWSQKNIDDLMAYLRENSEEDSADYFRLRLMDLPVSEIEKRLGLTAQERDSLQQRFKSHLLQFANAHHWELVHEWLSVELSNNFGLTPQQWDSLQVKMNQNQRKVLQLKQQSLPERDIAQTLDLSLTQIRKNLTEILQQVWEMTY